MVMISDYDSDSDCKDVGSDDNEEGDKKLWWEDNMIFFYFLFITRNEFDYAFTLARVRRR